MTRTSIVKIWTGLMAATALTWWAGESGVSHSGGIGALALIFGLAWVKGRWIALDFMELRQAPALWRRLMMGWLSGVLAVIVACALWGAR